MFRILIIFYFLFLYQNIFSQKNYFVSNNGNSDFNTIAQINSADLKSGDIVSFKSGEQFSDAVLKCKKGVTYNTFGGTEKAILGNPTSTVITTQTISIEEENVTLDNLKIIGFANSKSVIVMHANYLTVTDCEIVGGENAHDAGTVGISQKGVANTGTGHKILRNEIHDLAHGIYITQPYNTEIAYNEMYDFYLLWGAQDYGGYGIGGGAFGGGSSSTDFWDTDYTFHIHHNNVYNFEYVAFQSNSSHILVEYNEIHHSLDERIYRGGVKHGSIGKMYDFQGVDGIGSLGLIFRYNYVHDLVRRGEANYSYEQQTKQRVKDKTFVVASTNNGIGHAVYLYSAREGGAYWPHFGDQIDSAGNPIGEGPDCVLSGLGYANFFVHNNIFYNCSNSINNRQYTYINGTTTEKPFRSDLGSYFINNTIINSGYLEYITNNSGGLLYSEKKSQSPHTVLNNIIDFTNLNARFTARWREDDIYVDHNIYTRQSGVVYTNWTGYPSSGDNIANVFDGGNIVLNEGQNDQYLTDPNWVDTTSTILVPNLSNDGAYIPDVRITSGGNAYDEGMDYDLIGDTYTDPAGFVHELGKDPTGRSFAYDIFGNLRTTNDIGALGTGTVDISPTTPTIRIVTQPTNQTVFENESVSFSLSATTNDTGEIEYQWWKSPFVSESESKILNSNKYSGAKTNSLTINSVTMADGDINYVCEVFNTSDPNVFVNSDVVSLEISQDQSPTEGSALKVLLEAPYGNGQMNTLLNSVKVFPTAQPYKNSPWDLESNDEISKIKSDFVDWVIIELNKSEKQITYRKPGILTSNGVILNPNGSEFSFNGIESNQYYITIKHRNHLAIMSLKKVQINNNEPVIYDFTRSINSAYGNRPMTDLGDGYYGMFAGDANADGVINNLDFGKVANNIPYKGYSNNDLDMNGSVNVLDYNKINKNILKGSQIPK